MEGNGDQECRQSTILNKVFRAHLIEVVFQQRLSVV